jgi:hypothetical protein
MKPFAWLRFSSRHSVCRLVRDQRGRRWQPAAIGTQKDGYLLQATLRSPLIPSQKLQTELAVGTRAFAILDTQPPTKPRRHIGEKRRNEV